MNLKALMRLRYEAQEWTLMFEVEINGGPERGIRRVDAMAMNLWHSRGFELHGFELKTSRSDWLRELKQPSKADAAFRFCDRWFVLATDGVVKPDEVPEPWGWIEIKGERMFTRKQAPKNAPEAWPRHLIAAMQRRTSRTEVDEIDALVRARLAPLEARLREDLASDKAALERHRKDFETKAAEIAKTTGINLLSWNPADKVSRALKIVNESRLFEDGHDGLDAVVARLRSKADDIEALRKELLK